MKVKIVAVITLLSILALLFGACAPIPAPSPAPTTPPSPSPVPSPTPTPTHSGTLQLYVTDAPPREQVTSIMVTVSEVQVHMAEAEQEREQEQSASDNETPEQELEQEREQDGESKWITIDLSDDATTFDLLEIKGIEQYLGASEVAIGKYTQVRLVVDTIQVSLGEGELQDATVPSNELKIVRPFDVIAGETTALILDFDADRMVTVTGSGDIIVKPVVKLTVKQEKPQDQKDKAKQEVSLEDTKWILQSYGEPENLKDVLEDTEITATFNKEEGQVTGSAGCNSYFGSYEAEDANLSIPGPIGATEMSCGEQKDTQEREYLSILQAAESYEIEDGKLTINCGNQVLILWK